MMPEYRKSVTIHPFILKQYWHWTDRQNL